ncbi:MAG: NAD(P)-binding domain-containing protein [Acidobacteriota bacterium]|nr:NAD(P)-binding domain-containing protein [Acidobacteriota bacterium]
MKLGVLGTGSVGTALGSGFVKAGHEVRMGSRDAGNEKGKAWATAAGPGASSGDFADAAGFGEIVFNATAGAGAVAAVRAAGRENLRGKILVDVSNPLDFSRGMPPTLFTAAAGDSLAERIQAEVPETKVVKTLNTINASLMLDPARVGGDSDLFIAGNDTAAKERVTTLLKEFGWKRVLDLGDSTAARGMEAYVLFWLQLYMAQKTPDFNIRIVKR